MRFLLLLPLLASLTNADVVKMVKAGLAPETIEAKIASSPAAFDTTPDALIALKNDGVPAPIIHAMVLKSPQVVESRPRAATRRYDVAIHTKSNARCENAELRIDGKGIKGSRCRKLDFDLAWSAVKNVCYDYGFRGTVTINGGAHRISTTTPAETKRIVDHIRANAPAVQVGECAR